MEKRTITIKVKLTPEEWVAFESKCDQVGFSQSAVGRWLIRQWLDSGHDFNIGQGSMFSNGGGPNVAHKSNCN